MSACARACFSFLASAVHPLDGIHLVSLSSNRREVKSMRRLRVQFRKGNGQPRVCSQMKIQMKQDLYVDAYDPLLARVDDAITLLPSL